MSDPLREMAMERFLKCVEEHRKENAPEAEPEPVRTPIREEVKLHMRGCDFELVLTADQVDRIFEIIMEPKKALPESQHRITEWVG